MDPLHSRLLRLQWFSTCGSQSSREKKRSISQTIRLSFFLGTEMLLSSKITVMK